MPHINKSVSCACLRLFKPGSKRTGVGYQRGRRGVGRGILSTCA